MKKTILLLFFVLPFLTANAQGELPYVNCGRLNLSSTLFSPPNSVNYLRFTDGAGTNLIGGILHNVGTGQPIYGNPDALCFFSTKDINMMTAGGKNFIVFPSNGGGNMGINTSNPKTTLNIYNNQANTDESIFTTGVSKSGILISTDYFSNSYTPGIFWSSFVPTKPSAGIYLKQTDTGTSMLFGVSEHNSIGIEKKMILNQFGDLSVPSKIGIQESNPTTTLQIRNNNISTTKTDFTEAVNKAGILISTAYTDNTFTPGIFWSNDWAPTRPSAGIFLKQSNIGGTCMLLGVSDAFTTGITHNITIDMSGNLTVPATIYAREVQVTLSAIGADYVFNDNYNLKSIKEVSNYINANKHLPDIASAEEMKKNGINISEFQIDLLRKIEELHLYLIQQNSDIDSIKNENVVLRKEIEFLKSNIK